MLKNADIIPIDGIDDDVCRAVALARYSGNAVFISASSRREELAGRAIAALAQGPDSRQAQKLDIQVLAGMPHPPREPFIGATDMDGFHILEKRPEISGFFNFVLVSDKKVTPRTDSVLIIGASSFFGNAVYSLFKTGFERVRGTGRSKAAALGLDDLDVTSEGQIAGYFKSKPQFDVIVYIAGEANADKAEDDRRRARALNVEAVRLIAKYAKNSKFVYISSEYVFDGKCGPYTSLTPGKPINYYGATKLEGEKEALENFPDCLVLRLGALYGYNGDLDKETSVSKLIRALEDGLPIKADNVQIKRPVLLQDAAMTLFRLLDLDERGIFQVNGPEGLTKLQMAEVIAQVRFELTGRPFDRSITGVDQPGRAAKPFNTHMVNIDTPRPFKDGIRFLYSRLPGRR